MEPFLFHLFYCFFNRNINEAVSEADFCMAKKFYQDFPLQTFEAIRSFGSREFSLFFARLMFFDNFASYEHCGVGFGDNRHFTGLSTSLRGGKLSYTFSLFDNAIGKCIFQSLKVSSSFDFKRVILEILSILRRIDFSSTTFTDSCLWHRFESQTMSTKVFIHSYTYFIEILEDDDSINGFQTAYCKLRHLSRYHNKISNVRNFRIKNLFVNLRLRVLFKDHL